MSVPSSSLRHSRPLLIVCTAILAILIVGTLSLARAVLIPLALAILLTFILAPAVTWAQHRGLRRVPAVIVVAVLAFLLIGVTAFGIFLQFRSLGNDLPVYQDNITKKIARLREAGQGSQLEEFQTAIDAVQKALVKPTEASANRETVPVVVQPSGTTHFEAVVGPTVSLLATAGLVIVLVIFMLIKRENLRNRLIHLMGHGHLTRTTKALDDAGQRISRFLLMQLLINAAFALVLGLGLFCIGVPYALLWGLLIGALRFVPYVGSTAGAVVLLTFGVAAFPGWAQPIVVLVFFVVLELVVANVAEPLLLGHSTGISPVALLVAAAFWTFLWGPVGLLLSTPLTVCFVVLGKYFSGLKFFDVLLGDEPVMGTHLRYYQRLLAHDVDEAIDLVEEQLREHPREQVYDEVLLPALVLTKSDRERGVLTEEEEEVLLQEMGTILEEVVPASQENCPDAEAEPAAGPSEESSSMVSVLGCPAGGEADELALRMFRQLLGPAGCQFQVLSSAMLAAELLSRIEQERPALICIAALPPAGLAGARYLCKRLRGRFPDLKIVVGRWGQVEKSEEADSRLRAAGAESVTTSMLATRSQLLPLLQVASAQSASEAPALKGASRERQPTPSSGLAGAGAGNGLADR